MFSSFKKQALPRLCSWIPLNLWHRAVGVDLVVPIWHVVSDQELEHVNGLYKFRNVRQFKADLEFFLKNYTPVSLDQVVSHINGQGRLPARCFLPTFDDGLREIYDIIAPILQRQGVPAVFFLITSAIDNGQLCYPQKKSLLLCALKSRIGAVAEREASMILSNAAIEGSSLSERIQSVHYLKRQVLDALAPVLGCDFNGYAIKVHPYVTSVEVSDLLKRGFSIGAHSVDHPLYSELGLEEQLFQTQESIRWLSHRFQYECESFAFPYRDQGMAPVFFERIFAGGPLQVSFGTGGLRSRLFSRNISRFSMERTDLPAAQIVARQYARALIHRG